MSLPCIIAVENWLVGTELVIQSKTNGNVSTNPTVIHYNIVTPPHVGVVHEKLSSMSLNNITITTNHYHLNNNETSNPNHVDLYICSS